MGAQSSTNIQQVNNDFSSSAYAKCNSTVGINTINMQDVTYTEPPQCPANSPGFNVQQATVVDANCAIGILQGQVNNQIYKLDAATQGGLGLQFSQNYQQATTNVQEYMDSECPNTLSQNAANLKDINVTACSFSVVQNANAQSQCQINELQQMTNTINSNVSSSSQGANLANFFGFSNLSTGGKILVIVGSIISCLVLIFVIYLLLKAFLGGGGGSAPQSFEMQPMGMGKPSPTTLEETVAENPELLAVGGGFMKSLNGFNSGDFIQDLKKNNSYLILIILIIAVLLIALYNCHKSTTPNINNITATDKTITEAHQIAGLQAVPKVPSVKNVQDIPGRDEFAQYYYGDHNYASENDKLNNFYQNTY